MAETARGGPRPVDRTRNEHTVRIQAVTRKRIRLILSETQQQHIQSKSYTHTDSVAPKNKDHVAVQTHESD